METRKLYASSASELRAYIRTRFAPGTYVPLAAFLCAGAVAGPGTFSWTCFFVGIPPALLLLLQFRVWDDLADRSRDAIAHPDRILPASRAIGMYRWLIIATAAVNTALVFYYAKQPAAGVFIGLNLMMLAWYGLLRRYLGHPLLNAHVVLLKYPAFVFVLNSLVAEKSAFHLGYSVLITYVALSVYELLHDPGLQRFSSSRRLLAIGSAVLIVAPLGLLACPAWGGTAAKFVAFGTSAMTAIILGSALAGLRQTPGSKYWRVAPLLVALVQIVILNLRSSQ